ncbi:GRF zinc finger family protein [Mycena chlorophos]|uniref:GRF zinc finger family protein n=1 Tax=Mycena chlorophos TaxID=658473 RepID=A0A8H6TP84_MYCCL|nr:GRF zinc finger family protein [Mycena chlorophos]
MADADTETLVVIVQTLLPTSHSSVEDILDALANCDGDPTAAAERLSSQSPSKKRRVGGLDAWLKGRKDINDTVKQPPLSVASTSPTRKRPPSSSSSSSSSRPTVDLMSVLRQAPKVDKAPQKLPPLFLSSPAMVAEHVPCVTLHPAILPPELACSLFYTMVDRAQSWSVNKWWLFDRVVESPHRTSFFARRTNGLDDNDQWQQAAQFWYNGRKTGVPETFPREMEEACRIIERAVNEEMKKRPRFPLEWAGASENDPGWRANVAASNCYEGGKDGVGFHSDQLTYLGPYTTIASLSLGTSRRFRLRETIPTQDAKTRQARTFNIPLTHNSLTIMHASCQEKFKHCIPQENVIDAYRPAYPRSPGAPIEPSNIRINITFRFYRPDFRPETIPRCNCDVPMILRPDMKNHVDDPSKTDKYWWTCYAGAQNDGKGCTLWKVFDMEKEGRGPVVGSASQAHVTPELPNSDAGVE